MATRRQSGPQGAYCTDREIQKTYKSLTLYVEPCVTKARTDFIRTLRGAESSFEGVTKRIGKEVKNQKNWYENRSDSDWLDRKMAICYYKLFFCCCNNVK